MKEQDLYKKLAKYYDYLYAWKDYKKEAEQIKEEIVKYKKSTGNKLLDMACGTGSHLEHFTDDYECTGIDINSEILEVAKSKGLKASFILGDMTDFDLGTEFDIILCLFSSIGYVKTKENLTKTIECFTKHLKKGGVLIIEPWLTKEIYRAGSPHMTTFDGEKLKIARVNISELKGDISYFEMHYLIAEENKHVIHFVDQHELALFPIELMVSLCQNNGLITHHNKEGLFDNHGLLIGVKE
ncbi:MAG: class I SAM-dependent methyltransferase [Candidatus Heimdallarchaeota archaeon]